MSQQLSTYEDVRVARLADVGERPEVRRAAVARGSLLVSSQTLNALASGQTAKGDALAVARVAGVQAAKSTPQLIPLCHTAHLTRVEVDFSLNFTSNRVDVQARVESVGRTSVEMEALLAVSVGALALYDMLKYDDPAMRLDGVTLVSKEPASARAPSPQVPPPKPAAPLSASPTPIVTLTPSPAPALASAPTAPPHSPAPPLAATELIPPPLGRSFRVIPKGAPQAPVNTQLFEELEAPQGSSESEVVSSCAPPLMVRLPPPEPEPDEPAVTQGTEEVEWDESILHEGSLSGASEHEEGPINAPALSQAAREMAREVREVPILYAPLVRYLLSRPLDCAYLLGYLTPEYTGRCRAFVYEEPRPDSPDYVEVQALLFEYTGLSVPTVWTFGGTLEVEAIIAHAYGLLPRRVYFNMEDHHLQAVRTHYAVRNRKPTLRMGLRRPHYRPASTSEGVVMLSHKDTGSIMRLYAQYPDHLFEPAQLDTGLYCGVRDPSGHLVSVAGIHLLNQDLNIAAIGNIVTDHEHRGRGLATRCVRALLDELFKGVENVALNVTEDNRPAIACYEKFGFRTTSRIIEAWAKLR